MRTLGFIAALLAVSTATAATPQLPDKSKVSMSKRALVAHANASPGEWAYTQRETYDYNKEGAEWLLNSIEKITYDDAGNITEKDIEDFGYGFKQRNEWVYIDEKTSEVTIYAGEDELKPQVRQRFETDNAIYPNFIKKEEYSSYNEDLQQWDEWETSMLYDYQIDENGRLSKVDYYSNYNTGKLALSKTVEYVYDGEGNAPVEFIQTEYYDGITDVVHGTNLKWELYDGWAISPSAALESPDIERFKPLHAEVEFWSGKEIYDYSYDGNLCERTTQSGDVTIYTKALITATDKYESCRQYSEEYQQGEFVKSYYSGYEGVYDLSYNGLWDHFCYMQHDVNGGTSISSYMRNAATTDPDTGVITEYVSEILENTPVMIDETDLEKFLYENPEVSDGWVNYKKVILRGYVQIPEDAGIRTIDSATDDSVPAEYFSLDGRRVNNPEAGIYIVRRGNNVSKQLVR